MNNRKVYLHEYIILAYMVLLTTLIFIFGHPLGQYYDELISDVIFVGIVLGAIFFLKDTDRNIVRFFRLLYPAALFTFFYRETGGLMFLFHPGFLDAHLTGFERAVLGVHPTFWIETHILNVWLTEILSLTYAAYYPMIPIFLILVYIKGDYQIVKKSLAAMCLSFFTGYLLFMLYPIEGPRYFFAGDYQYHITGPVFRQFVEFVQKTGSVHGGCMPSTHVAVAVVMTIFCLKYYRKAGIMLLVINTGMALGTFYGRYHYVSDVIVGAMIGIIMTWLVMKYHDRIAPPGSITKKTAMEKIKSVS